jgi:hypothetical protein
MERNNTKHLREPRNSMAESCCELLVSLFQHYSHPTSAKLPQSDRSRHWNERLTPLLHFCSAAIPAHEPSKLIRNRKHILCHFLESWKANIALGLCCWDSPLVKTKLGNKKPQPPPHCQGSMEAGSALLRCLGNHCTTS